MLNKDILETSDTTFHVCCVSQQHANTWNDEITFNNTAPVDSPFLINVLLDPSVWQSEIRP